MDYLCEKFEGVLVETKVVREYYWNKHIRDLIEKKVSNHKLVSVISALFSQFCIYNSLDIYPALSHYKSLWYGKEFYS